MRELADEVGGGRAGSVGDPETKTITPIWEGRVRLFMVDISFEDGDFRHEVFQAKDANDALDAALAKYPTATSVGTAS